MKSKSVSGIRARAQLQGLDRWEWSQMDIEESRTGKQDETSNACMHFGSIRFSYEVPPDFLIFFLILICITPDIYRNQKPVSVIGMPIYVQWKWNERTKSFLVIFLNPQKHKFRHKRFISEFSGANPSLWNRVRRIHHCIVTSKTSSYY